MSKTYIVSRNGGTVTKAPINDNKIPIYANETALDADLSNLADNTLVLLQNSGVYEVYTENGTKKKKQITGNGYGLPLGSIIAVYSNLVPDGYLPCNGAVFDTTTFAALYAYLGSNRLPDLRECNLVGAGQSSNDYDASTNPNGIHAHDVYAVGEFKDDQLQGHYHQNYGSNYQFSIGDGYRCLRGSSLDSTILNDTTRDLVTDGTNGTPRVGSTTHGKQVGVNYCIKATPAYVEPDTVSDMVNTLRTQDSYSTSEVNTGKKWIDGKPIYRRVFEAEENKNISSNTTVSGWSTVITNLSNVINTYMTASDSTEVVGNPFFARYKKSESKFYFSTTAGGNWNVSIGDIFILEYTKTTD